MATVAELLAQSAQLASVSDTARLDTELLLAHCLQKTRSYLRAWNDAEVDEPSREQFQALLARRLQGEPVAYLIGSRGFWTLDLNVSPATLIPRPETELLVELALSVLVDNAAANVLDLGTGTGAIALALASEKPSWSVMACDREVGAVQLAEENRLQLQLSNIHVFQSDWFSEFADKRFDLIVSNPPYIDEADPHLQQGDVRFEPLSALVAGERGLADIRKIIDQAPGFLTDNGWLLFEHGYQQAQEVQALFLSRGFVEVFTRQDLAGLDRVTAARWGGRSYE